MSKYFFALMGAMSLTLCSCFSRTAQVADFGKSLTAEYGQAHDGAEYVDLHADLKHNSALIMPSIQFSAEQDTIHVEAVLSLVKPGKSSLDFPWRIALTHEINRITFGPKKEIIWQRETGAKNTNRRTKSQILMPCGKDGMASDRFYAEVDLTGDGLNELIISDSISTAGTGGIEWTIHRAAEPDKYFMKTFRFGSGIHSLAVEDDLNSKLPGKRLWCYWHVSGKEGIIAYIFVNQKGEFAYSPGLYIFTGDGGTESGNKIFSSVFSPESRLKIKSLGKSGNFASQGQ